MRMTKKKQIMNEDYVSEEPKDSVRYPKNVNHDYLKINNFLKK